MVIDKGKRMPDCLYLTNGLQMSLHREREIQDVAAFFCHGDEENGHRACTNGHLTTADQSEIRKAYLASVAKHMRKWSSGPFLSRCFGLVKNFVL